MNIFIVGCDKFGSLLARRLSAEGHDITVIDKDRHRLQALADSSDVIGYIGNGTSFRMLSEAGIENADIFIAVTGEDETNLLACVIAKKAGDKLYTAARVQDLTYFTERVYLRQSLGISVIVNPSLMAATEIARLTRTPETMAISTFARGRAEVQTVTLPQKSSLVGLPLSKMKQKYNTDVLVCAVKRGSETSIPRGDFVFETGDVISVTGSPSEVAKFFSKSDISTHKVRSVLIFGGGEIANYIAFQLSKMNMNIKIIEEDPTRCEELSEELSDDVLIINGSSSDSELLDEEGLDSSDAVIAVTDVDSENMMLSLLTAARNKTALRVTKLKELPFDEVLETLNLGPVVCPTELAAEQIIQYVRSLHNSVGISVETLYRILGGRVEALEFIINSESDVTGIPLAEMNLRHDVLICSIIRRGKIINPGGGDSIMVGDSVVAVTTRTGVKSIYDLFEGGKIRRADVK
ncbi:MAG: Trk system potassium transporter TrkA [Firmicutes bacterium]|nr:Trk system potassium transporter TrkA [Bacillota bacterium]